MIRIIFVIGMSRPLALASEIIVNRIKLVSNSIGGDLKMKDKSDRRVYRRF